MDIRSGPAPVPALSASRGSVTASRHHASLHASTVLLGDGAILVRGKSGTGKTSLALAVIAQATVSGRLAMLVCDDRTMVRRAGGRLVASAVAAITGLVERRGLGLAPVRHEPRAIVRLVVDCMGHEPERMPEPETLLAQIEGVTLPRLAVRGGAGDAGLVLAAFELFTL